MAKATIKERSNLPTPKLKLITSERVKITEVSTSKMTIDDNVASFKTSFDVRTLKAHGVPLEDIVNILNRVADMTIVPYQQNAKFVDPGQGDAFNGGDEKDENKTGQ